MSDNERMDWMETTPQKDWGKKPGGKSGKPMSHWRYGKVARHLTRGGKGLIAKLRRDR